MRFSEWCKFLANLKKNADSAKNSDTSSPPSILFQQEYPIQRKCEDLLCASYVVVSQLDRMVGFDLNQSTLSFIAGFLRILKW